MIVEFIFFNAIHKRSRLNFPVCCNVYTYIFNPGQKYKTILKNEEKKILSPIFQL